LFFFPLICILSLSSEILSSTCSLCWSGLPMCFYWTKGTFYFQDLFDSFFWGFPYVCWTLLSYLVLSSLFHISPFL
jgi:hypothetical protein